MTSCATILVMRIRVSFLGSLESPAEAAKTARAQTFRMLMTVGWPRRCPHLGEGMRRGWRGLRISAKLGYRRPVRQNWRRRRSQRRELLSRIDGLTAHDGQDRFELLYLLIRNREIIRRQHGQVCELPGNNRPLAALFGREPTAAHSPEPQRLHPLQAIRFVVHGQTADGLPCTQPIQRYERVVARDTGGIGSSTDRQA